MVLPATTSNQAISNQQSNQQTKERKNQSKMTDVDISMFSTDSLKLTLLYSLVNKSTGGSCKQFMTPEATLDQYDHALAVIKAGRIDRFNGRVIKGSIKGDTFSTYLYNRDNGGPGTAEKIIEELRKILNI